MAGSHKNQLTSMWANPAHVLLGVLITGMIGVLVLLAYHYQEIIRVSRVSLVATYYYADLGVRSSLDSLAETAPDDTQAWAQEAQTVARILEAVSPQIAVMSGYFATDAQMTRQLEHMAEQHQAILATLRSYGTNSANRNQLIQELEGMMAASSASILDVLIQLNSNVSEFDQNLVELVHLQTVLGMDILLFLVILVCMVVVTVWISVMQYTRLQRMPRLAMELVNEEQQINLSKRFAVSYKDEIRIFTQDTNQFLDQLSAVLGPMFVQYRKMQEQLDVLSGAVRDSVRQSTDLETTMANIETHTEEQLHGLQEILSLVTGVGANTQDVVNSVNKQVNSVQSSATAVEQMGRNIEMMTHVSAETRALAQNLNTVAQEGSTAVSKAVHSIQDVTEYSKQIMRLLKLISDIAKQTNLLAMNASIEAAHAGEAGRGFAIVADEIRRLSETTNKNAKEIGAVVSTMLEKIDQSAQEAQVAGDGLGKVTDYASQTEFRMNDLNHMVEEQNTANGEVLRGIRQLVESADYIRTIMEDQQSGVSGFEQTTQQIRDLFTLSHKEVETQAQLLRQLSDVLQESSKCTHALVDISDTTAQYAQNITVDPVVPT